MKTLHRITVCAVLVCWPLLGLAETFVFTAPPRETPERGQADYGPIAEYLSSATGAEIVYQHSNNWLSYMKDMQKAKYDLIFDGPHFVSWRVERLNHTPLVRLPGGLDFVVVSRTDDPRIVRLEDLAGYQVCGHAPPNLATLTLQAQFLNPARQPQIREVKGFANAFEGVIDKSCRGATLPAGVYRRLDKGDVQGKTRILFQSKPLPHQALSADPRVPKALQERITNALLAPEGVKATARLRERFAGGKRMLAATIQEYQGYAYLLRDFYGFGF